MDVRRNESKTMSFKLKNTSLVPAQVSLKLDSDEIPKAKDDSKSLKSDGFFIMDQQSHYTIEAMSDKTFVLQFTPSEEKVFVLYQLEN